MQHALSNEMTEIERTYARAIHDAASVICAQIAAAEQVGDEAAHDMNGSLDQIGQLKDHFSNSITEARKGLVNEAMQAASRGGDASAERLKELQTQCEAIENDLFSELSLAVLGLAASVQFQDIQRQILEEISQIVRDLAEVDLSTLSGSIEGADVPRKILENARARYVMQLQRTAHAQALGEHSGEVSDDHDLLF